MRGHHVPSVEAEGSGGLPSYFSYTCLSQCVAPVCSAPKAAPAAPSTCTPAGSMTLVCCACRSLKDKVAACATAAVPYFPAITAQPSAAAAHSRPSTRTSPFQVVPRGTGHAPHADPPQRDYHQQPSWALHTSMPAPRNPPAELQVPSMHQPQDHQQLQQHQQLHPPFLHQQHHHQEHHQPQQCHHQPLTQQPHSFKTPAGQPTMSNTSSAAPQSSAQAAFLTSAAAGAVPPWAGHTAAGPVGKRRRGPSSRSGSAQPMAFDRAASGGAEEALYDGSGSEEGEDDENAGGAGGAAPPAAGAAAALANAGLAALLPPGSWAPPQGVVPGPVDVYVFGKKQQVVVTGRFHPDRYLAGQDCIWYQDQ